MPVTEFLERNALQWKDDVALVEINPEQKGVRRGTWKEYNLIEASNTPFYRKEITWGVFNEKANRFANALLGAGIGKGNKVAILMMNCLEWLPVYFGVLKSGAVAVPMNFRYSSEEIRYCLNLADVDLLVFGAEFIGRLEEIVDDMGRNIGMLYCGDSPCPTFAYDYTSMTADYSSENPGIPLSDDEDAAIYFSSGTTGFPKAILHHHISLVHSCKVEQNHHGQTKDDVFLCIPPLYHTGAKMHWFGSLLVGAKSVLLKGTEPKFILEAASRERCTIVWLLVPWAQDILTAIENGTVKLEDYELSQWRLMHIGAQPVPQSLIRRWKEYFPNHAYDTNYGLSESIGPGCVHLGVENIHKVGAIGLPGYGWEVKIAGSDNEVITKPRQVGELCVKGPGVMVCYYHNPEATAESIRDGWLYTGDMAEYDEDGFIFLVDRKKDVIITGGENLYPVEIENFLSAQPDIQDVAVIGLPDSRLGEIAAAIIQIKEGHTCDEETIQKFCSKMPRYKRPRKIIFADVPRNATGKIEKPLLRERYGATKLVTAQNKA